MTTSCNLVKKNTRIENERKLAQIYCIDILISYVNVRTSGTE
jgi:hypothetical protein